MKRRPPKPIVNVVEYAPRHTTTSATAATLYPSRHACAGIPTPISYLANQKSSIAVCVDGIPTLFEPKEVRIQHLDSNRRRSAMESRKEELKYEIERQVAEQLAKRGAPLSLQQEKVNVAIDDRKITARWGGIEISAPTPSPQAIDSAFKRFAKDFGMAFAGALIAVGTLALGMKLGNRS